MDLLIWAGKVSLYSLCFYGCYYLFLRRLTYFRWNRGYLLMGLVLSFVLPFAKMPTATTEPLAAYVVPMDPVRILAQPDPSQGLSWMYYVGIGYLIVAGFFLIRLIKRLLALNKVWKKGIYIETEDEKVEIYLLPDNRISSFSFFNKIAISQADYATHFNEILSHEMVHVTQRHSFDILFIEILRCLFWFNPLFPFYKKSLQEIHEYLADEHTTSRDRYAEFLVAYALGVPQLSLVNNFYKSSLLKQRIQMLYRDKSPAWKYSLYGFTGVFVFVLLTWVAACSESGRYPEVPPSSTAPSEKEARTSDDPIFLVVEKVPEFPGGTPGLYKFLSSTIRYPDAAARAGVEGRVFLEFVVGSDGSISDVSVVKGIGFGCDDEAVRVVKAMPKWRPGTQGGKPVNVKYVLPINFLLEESGDIPNSNRETVKPTVLKLHREVQEVEVKPLYVIDGKVADGVTDINHIKAGEIESVSVLKGDPAVTKYGGKGKDGVVEVWIKK